MCFSERASIVSFAVGIISALLCVSLGTVTDRIIGFFFTFVSLMQGVEYLLWKHQVCDDYNRLISRIGLLLNNIQPFVLGFVILMVNPQTPYKNWIMGLMVLYLCVNALYSTQFRKDKQCTIKDKKTGHLKWNWILLDYNLQFYVFFITIFCLLFIMGLHKLTHGIVFAIITFITYITSAIFYTQEFSGTLWCYYVVFIPLLYYLLRVSILTKI
jgi:hypothetical protein